MNGWYSTGDGIDRELWKSRIFSLLDGNGRAIRDEARRDEARRDEARRDGLACLTSPGVGKGAWTGSGVDRNTRTE
jgi:hypothetical protein